MSMGSGYALKISEKSMGKSQRLLTFAKQRFLKIIL